MNTRTILSRVAVVAGEAVIIAAFFIWQGNTPDNIFWLNLIVATIVYCLLFIDVLIPWVDFRDKARRRISSLGLIWFVTGLYALFSVGFMLLAGPAFSWPFEVQLIGQCSLVVLLAFSFAGVMHASAKVVEIHGREESHKAGILAMRHALASLSETMAGLPELPDSLTERIHRIEEDLRYVSPSATSEAADLERQFTDIAGSIASALPDYRLNRETIETLTAKAERICKRRKALYSN